MTREPPDHLDEQARLKWAELLPTLQARGDLDQGVLDALAAYCSAWSRWTAAENKVNELGAVVKSPAGFAVPNPYLAVAKDAQRQMRQWADVLGLHKRGRKKADQADERSEGAAVLRLLGGKPKGRAAG